MVLEVATIHVNPGTEDAFTAAFQQARHLPAGTPGCRSVRMTRGVETPHTPNVEHFVDVA